MKKILLVLMLLVFVASPAFADGLFIKVKGAGVLTYGGTSAGAYANDGFAAAHSHTYIITGAMASVGGNPYAIGGTVSDTKVWAVAFGNGSESYAEGGSFGGSGAFAIKGIIVGF